MYSFEESYQIFSDIFDGKKTEDEIESLLRALAKNGETFEEIAGAAKAMQEHAISISPNKETFDVCGTGGSSTAKTFNVSTTVSLVLASQGVCIAKHGNRAASSQSGSADVLEALGMNIAITPEEITKNLQEKNIAFLFAQTLHPAMKHIMPIRKKIGTRTIFNMVGPLTNPTNPSKQVVGVSSQSLLDPMIQALQILGKKTAMVLWGEDGLDEATIRGKTHYKLLHSDGTISSGIIIPEQFGIRSLQENQTIRGGNPEENAQIIREILEGKNEGAERDIVLLNAGIAFYVSQKTGSIEEGIALAEKAIITKDALKILHSLQS